MLYEVCAYAKHARALGGATSGTGNLNMYASTIGLMPTVGVGIGTTVPSASLHIKNATTAMRITGNLTNTSTRPSITTTPGACEIRGSSANADANDDGFLRLSAGGGSGVTVPSYIDISGYSTVGDMDKNIVFGTQGAERMRIVAGGNVGIGTASPGYLLTVGVAAAPAANSAGTTTIQTYGNINLYRNRLIFSSGANDWNHCIFNSSQNLDNEGTFDGFKYNGYNGHWFRVGNAALGTVPVTGMFIDAAGKVGIGTTTPLAALHSNGAGDQLTLSNSTNANCQFILSVDTAGNTRITSVQQGTANRNIIPTIDSVNYFGVGTNRWAGIYAVNGTIQTSDTKEKDSVPLTYGLNEIMQMRTILYKWKRQADLPDDAPEKNYQYYGFCADELSPLFPELVYDENKEAPVQMNYSELMPVMVNAIKEQNATIVSLESKIGALEARLAAAGL